MHGDFETYSEAGYHWDANTFRWVGDTKNGKSGIAAVGSWVYTAHPSAEVISFAWDGVHCWVPGMPEPLALFDYIRKGGILYAWNSFFEYCAWNNIAVPKLGWPKLPLEQLRCAMARAKAWGLPGKLENAGKALELDDANLKDPIGTSLKKKITIPRSPTSAHVKAYLAGAPIDLKHVNRCTIEVDPAAHAAFSKYNVQDTVSEAAICKLTPPLPPQEESLWLLDQKINARGAHIDRESLENCVAIFHQAERQYTQELRDLTGNKKQTVNELQQIQDWMLTQGVRTSSLDSEHVESLLKTELPKNVRRVLQIRQILGSASVKKLFSIRRHMDPNDDRIRGIFAYCGAERTGRFAGMGPQPHNMPASGPSVKECAACHMVQWEKLSRCRNCGGSDLRESDWGIEAVELALVDISTRNLSTVEHWWGDPLDVVSGCLRGLYTAAAGNDLLCSDYSAIEAVVLAVLAGEDWRVVVFRTHGKIYEMSASKISGVPFDEMMQYKKDHGQHHPLRKKIGKVAELASGYNGWIGAWKNFGADKFMADDEIKSSILKWREESPMIVEFWGGQYRKHPDRWEFIPELFGLEGAAVAAIQSPGKCFAYRSITYGVKDDVLYCRLPSGRCLAYHKPRLTPLYDDMRRVPYFEISFMGWNSDALKGPVGWRRIQTYSGKLTENVVQAASRDVLTYAMPGVERAGYPIVLHVHDEICSEVPSGYGSVAEYELIMKNPPPWARDWPIKAAGGWRGLRYRK